MLLNQFLLLAAVLFCIGVYGVITRRNGVLVLMSIELILNSVNINLVAFGRQHGVDGPGVRPVRDRRRRRRGWRRPGHRAAIYRNFRQRRARHRRVRPHEGLITTIMFDPRLDHPGHHGGLSFVLILFFGKKTPGKGQIGIAAVGICFVLSLVTAGEWITRTRPRPSSTAPWRR
jgi:hypothetical protein